MSLVASMLQIHACIPPLRQNMTTCPCGMDAYADAIRSQPGDIPSTQCTICMQICIIYNIPVYLSLCRRIEGSLGIGVWGLLHTHTKVSLSPFRGDSSLADFVERASRRPMPTLTRRSRPLLGQEGSSGGAWDREGRGSQTPMVRCP